MAAIVSFIVITGVSLCLAEENNQHLPQWQPWSAWSSCEGTQEAPTCARKADFLIIQDVSGSIGNPDLDKAANFLSFLVLSFSSQDRIAFQEFADRSKMFFDFTVFANSDTNITAVRDAVKNFKRSYSGGTSIGGALSYANKSVFIPIAGDRPDATNMVLTVTDGQDGSSSVKTWADELRKHGVITLALGIGSGVNEGQLEVIAGNRSRVFLAKDFDALNDTLAQQISTQTCPGFVKRGMAQTRRRTCSTYTGCQGDAIQNRPCDNLNCNQWSVWSECCSVKKTKSRTRRCRTSGYASQQETQTQNC